MTQREEVMSQKMYRDCTNCDETHQNLHLTFGATADYTKSKGKSKTKVQTKREACEHQITKSAHIFLQIFIRL